MVLLCTFEIIMDTLCYCAHFMDTLCTLCMDHFMYGPLLGSFNALLCYCDHLSLLSMKSMVIFISPVTKQGCHNGMKSNEKHGNFIHEIFIRLHSSVHYTKHKT